MEFCDRLKELRERRNFTQVHMAQKLYMARQTYLDLETGKTEPRLTKIIDISIILNCDILWLMMGGDENNISPLSNLKNKRIVIEGSVISVI